MNTLHIDMGREMQGGQWQVLYLLEKLKDAKLKTRCERLASEAEIRRIDFKPTPRRRGEPRWEELIHAHDARAHSFAIGGPPIVVSRRVGFPIKRAIWSRWKYQRASMYLAVSEFVKTRLLEAGVEERLIRVVHDGVPVPPIATKREPRLVVALASKPVDIPGIPIRMTQTLWDDLHHASVFVYRSEMEGLGSAALAAQAAGVPVIASTVGGLPEAIEHGRTGLLVDGDNFEPAIRRLLANPKEAEEMGMRGRERVEKTFTVDIMVQKTISAYEEVMARTKGEKVPG